MKPKELRFAECRSLGHEWRKGKQPVGIDDNDGYRKPFGMSTGMIGIPSHCPNCGTHKVRWITRSGESHTRYEYPDGYSRHGDDRLTAQEWRHNYVETIWEQFESNVARITGRKKAS